MDSPDNIYRSVINSPIGKLGISTTATKLIKIDFLTAATKTIKPNHQITQLTAAQLDAYFHDADFKFTIPFELNVTPFQQKVLDALLQIEVGKTRTYGELAKIIQSFPRASGNACRRNPIPIIIPCHRILAKNHLGGFSGQTDGDMLTVKKWLLNHERVSYPA